MSTVFLSFFRKIFFFLTGFLGLFFGDPYVPAVGPNNCEGMAAYSGVTAMPAGMTCTAESWATVFWPDSSIGYEADGTITPAAVDSWLAAQSPGLNLTQQPCWADHGTCYYRGSMVKTVDGVRQTLIVEVSAGAFQDGSVNFWVKTTRWLACDEQSCPASALSLVSLSG